MAEFLANEIQTIAPGNPVALRTSIGCNKGYVYRRPESGVLILRGIVNNPCCNFARYQATFNGNIAIPESGTPGPIAVALSIDGQPIPTSKAIVTPTEADAYFNVTSTAIIDVPRGCCVNVSVMNVSESPTPATTPAPTINVQNSNLVVSRIA